MAVQRSYIFNLLKPISPPQTSWDRVYDWLVGKAKLVIMITQVIIAITFFAKVILDTMAKNREETIEQLELEISFYEKERRPLYWKIQAKDDNYWELWSRSSNVATILTEIYSYIPNLSADVSVLVDGDYAILSGNDSNDFFIQLEAALKDSSTFIEADASLYREQEDFEEGTGKATFYTIISENILYRGPF